jgi:hypothetical protein
MKQSGELEIVKLDLSKSQLLSKRTSNDGGSRPMTSLPGKSAFEVLTHLPDQDTFDITA